MLRSSNVHILLAFFALMVLYTYGGNMGMLIAAPHAIYITLKRELTLLPAILVHCAAGNSVSILIFLIFVYFTLSNYKRYPKEALHIFWCLVALLPIMVFLVYQKIFLDGIYVPIAIMDIQYYLAFFAFFYMFSINSNTEERIDTAKKSLLVVLSLCIIQPFLNESFFRISQAGYFLSFSILAALLCKKIRLNATVILSIISIIIFLTNRNVSEFTILFTSCYSFLIAYLYFNNHWRALTAMTGYLPFFVILVLYAIAIHSYLSIENLRFDEAASFFDRLKYKFFADRAPYWTAAVKQIAEYRHLFPIHDMPDMTATLTSGREVDFSFGAHTTFLALIRNFGFIPGIILCLSYIKCTILSGKVFKVQSLNPYLIIIYATAISSLIIICLTGTYTMMLLFATFSFGFSGMAYSEYTQQQLYS